MNASQIESHTDAMNEQIEKVLTSTDGMRRVCILKRDRLYVIVV